MNESPLMRQIQVKMSLIGARLFRNNVGTAWAGQVFRPRRACSIHIGPQDIVIRNARPLHAGLATGSGDLIGWTPTKITPEMVGKTVAIFSTLEVKTKTGRLSTEQQSWNSTVTDAGGIAVVARSVEDAVEGILEGPKI